jgi:hypothetical protein
MIQGYFDEMSALPGQAVTIRIATDAPQFRIDFFRQGASFDLRESIGWTDGSDYRGDDHLPWDDWGKDGTLSDGSGPAAGWNGLQFWIPDNWQSGVYIAIFVEGDGSNNPLSPLPDFSTPDARYGKAMLVIRNPVPGIDSQLLYKVALFTYQSYNKAGGNSIYQGVDVSLHRPGGGTGGVPWDQWNYDPWEVRAAGTIDKSTPRQVFANQDSKFIGWLEKLGYRIDYCTDADVHKLDALSMLKRYAVMLSVGHDEYYSDSMRTNLKAFVDGGGNIAFFSGNTCWWRTEFDAEDPFRMLGQQTIHHWSDAAVGDPEDSLTGVSWRNGAEGNKDRPKVGYTLQRTELWPFEDVGVAEGDVIGVDDWLVGYECDSTDYDTTAPAPAVPRFNPADQTPAGFVILGTANLKGLFDVNGNGTATMGMYTRAGTVFTAATTDWPRTAALGDQRVGGITRNVIDRLGGNPKGLAQLGNFDDVIACDGFFTPDDGFRHAIVATADGSIIELFYNPDQGQGDVVLSTQAGLCDICGFWSEDDQYRHVIFCTTSGAISEVFFHPSTGVGIAPLGNIPGAIRVAGFYSPDDQYRHAIVATVQGDVWEIFFHPKFGNGQTLLGKFDGLVDIGAFYTADDQYRHVIVGQQDGTVSEIYYRPDVGISQVAIGNVVGLMRVSGYYAADDKFFNRRVTVLCVDGQVHELRFSPATGIVRSVLFLSEALDLGSFYSSDDHYRHAILANKAGSAQELFFRP